MYSLSTILVSTDTIPKHLMKAPIRVSLAIILASGSQTLGAQQKRAITFDDFAAVRAVADPQVAPDGRSVLYSLRTTDVGANRRTGKTFMAAVAGGAPHIFPADEVNASEARWSPDGRRVVYVAGGQLWIADADGSNRSQVTKLNGGATGPVLSPTGSLIAVTAGGVSGRALGAGRPAAGTGVA